MPTLTKCLSPRRHSLLSSFTLIELLVVMAIIAILASLILYASIGVIAKGQRSRASSEIQAISTALESYKTDNGIYPPSANPGFQTNTPYTAVDPAGPASANLYIASSEILYQQLSGQTNFTDQPVVGNKAYLSFKANQLGNATASGTTATGATTYYQDPFNHSYGYNTGNVTANSTNAPYNGYGFFDLWSTGGKTGTSSSNTNSFISNWQ